MIKPRRETFMALLPFPEQAPPLGPFKIVQRPYEPVALLLRRSPSRAEGPRLGRRDRREARSLAGAVTNGEGNCGPTWDGGSRSWGLVNYSVRKLERITLLEANIAQDEIVRLKYGASHLEIGVNCQPLEVRNSDGARSSR